MKRITLTLFAALITLGLFSQERIYNGITLASQWPPRYEEPATAREMNVPYLVNKPEVITINVGRQLFIDSFLVAKTNMEYVCHKPTFYSANPVIEPDREWEMTIEGAQYASPFSDGIWYDERECKFKMWYLAGAGLIHKEEKQTFYTCYAESDDGMNWTKTIKDVYPNTNIVDTCNRDASTIWLDKKELNPAKRYKMFNVERRQSDRRWQFILKYSSDGIYWSDGVAQSGDMYDRSSVFYNPFRDVWCLSMRYSTAISSRSRSYLENKDPEMAVSLAHRIRKDALDKNIVFWFTPDDKEPRHPQFQEVNPGIYNFDCIAYESIMLGQYSVWQGPENSVCAELGIQKKNEVFLGYSRDGFHFSRPFHTPFLQVNEREDAWNWGNMQSINGTPLIVGDSLYFYSSGRRLNKIMWDSYSSTGLAKLRRDGFISLRAENRESFVETELLSFDGSYLFINAQVKEQIRVELIDETGSVIRGFSKKESVPLKDINSTRQLVTWKENRSLASLKGKNIRIKFYVTNGDLYSFWISPWESGESRGYTAGGGPGLNEKGVDIPK